MLLVQRYYNLAKGETMSVQVTKGAVKFNSIRAMAETLAAKTGEPVNRVYIRLYMRMRAGKNASKAFHAPKRKYTMQETVAA